MRSARSQKLKLSGLNNRRCRSWAPNWRARRAFPRTRRWWRRRSALNCNIIECTIRQFACKVRVYFADLWIDDHRPGETWSPFSTFVNLHFESEVEDSFSPDRWRKLVMGDKNVVPLRIITALTECCVPMSANRMSGLQWELYIPAIHSKTIAPFRLRRTIDNRRNINDVRVGPLGTYDVLNNRWRGEHRKIYCRHKTNQNFQPIIEANTKVQQTCWIRKYVFNVRTEKSRAGNVAMARERHDSNWFMKKATTICTLFTPSRFPL